MNMETGSTSWESYEKVAAFLLNRFRQHFGLATVEGKQQLGQYEIDARGIREGDSGFIIIECKRHTTSRPNQGILGNLAWQIIDTGATGGIIVSPLGIQQGAQKIADKMDIISVQLNADCTAQEFVMQFLNRVMISHHETLTLKEETGLHLSRHCDECGRSFEVPTVKHGVRYEVVEDEPLCPVCRSNRLNSKPDD